ncbi:phosphate-selective porin [Desulfuromonas soudanensis]|uniref:Phosphate-selective porin n=1 Tax=Desulfuromonas soudanensis TaxID=1603606 RepID=A0A0M4D079_9BACT|nr:porin [Desulfuromonas soudanensis]ALC15858.1 phosphate-selective porin [Desulfuromonas soudanensis]
MRKKIFLSMALLTVSVGLTAQGEAKSIEEILKEKGVITVEEYQEAVTQKPDVAYVPGKGFTAATADGKYKLHIGGYAQLLYKYTDVDSNAADDKSDFNIRRFKLQIAGNVVSKDFGYKFQGDMKNGFTTEDAFINYKFAAPLTVQVGQFKPAQARQELTSAAKQLFPERSLANDTFNLGRDLGVQAAGSFAGKIVEYRLGLFNGNGPNTANPDDRHMVTGRLDLNPLGAYAMDEAGWTSDKPLLNIGGSFAWNKIGGGDVGSGFSKDNDVMDVALNLDDAATAAAFTANYGSDLTWLLWTANVNAAWMGATLAGEYYALNADPSLGSDWDADGYYVQAGYQVIPQTLELAARYSAVESTDTQASAKFDKAETQFGVNYYFAKHAAKVQADYTLVSDDWNADKDDNIVRLQAQFYY